MFQGSAKNLRFSEGYGKNLAASHKSKEPIEYPKSEIWTGHAKYGKKN